MCFLHRGNDNGAASYLPGLDTPYFEMKEKKCLRYLYILGSIQSQVLVQGQATEFLQFDFVRLNISVPVRRVGVRPVSKVDAALKGGENIPR